MTRPYETKCVICGDVDYRTYECTLTGRARCEKETCIVEAKEFKATKDKIMMDFAKEKELLLRPLMEKLEAELFLNERAYFGDWAF